MANGIFDGMEGAYLNDAPSNNKVGNESNKVSSSIFDGMEDSYLDTSQTPVKPKESKLTDFYKYGSSDEAIIAHQEDQMRVAAYIPTAKKVYRMADKQIEMGRLGDLVMENKATPEQTERINILNKEIYDIHQSIKSSPYEARAAAQLIPYAQNALSKGGKAYLAGFMLGSGAMAIAGSAVPGPEEAITAPAAGHLLGKAFSTFAVAEDMRKIEGGNAYIKLIQDGVDPNIAKWAGRSYGMVSSLAETYQLHLLGKLLPGAKNVVTKPVLNISKKAINKAPQIIQRSIRKAVKSKVAGNTLVKAVSKQAYVSSGEATVEATQQFFENVIGIAAKEVHDYAKAENLSPQDAMEYWKSIKGGIAESFAQTFVGVGILSIPSVGVNFVSDTISGKKAFGEQQDLKLRVQEEMENSSIKPKEEVIMEPDIVEEETPIVEEEKIIEEVEKPTRSQPVQRDETTGETLDEIPVEEKTEVTEDITPTKTKKQKEIDATPPERYFPKPEIREEDVKWFQKDLTKPAIRTSDGSIYQGPELSGTWSISKPNIAIEEGPISISNAKEQAREEGKKLQDEDGNIFYEQGFMIGDNFISTKTIANKTNLIEKTAKAKAERISKQGINELKIIEREKERRVIRKEKLKKLRTPTKQDSIIIEKLQPTIKKAVRSFMNKSPALSSLFSFDDLFNVANEGALSYILKTNEADIDAFINGKDRSKIKGSTNKASNFSIKNFIKKQLGSKQGKTRDRIQKELKNRVFKDVVSYEEGKRSSIAEGEESAIEESHFEGKEAPRIGKSVKDKYLGKVYTDEEVESYVKKTASPVKKISVKQHLEEIAKENKRLEKIEAEKKEAAIKKFSAHRPTKLSKKEKLNKEERRAKQEAINQTTKASINKKQEAKSTTLIDILDNESGETIILGNTANKIIKGYEVLSKKLHPLHKMLDIEAAWKKYPDIGKTIKGIFSIQTIEQQKGLDVVKELVKIIKKSHIGYIINKKDLGEIVLAAEDPKYLEAMTLQKQKRIKPAADFIAKYFKDSQKELADKGISVNFKERMIEELKHRIEIQDSSKDIDGEKVAKYEKYIKILERTNFVHIPLQMWTMGKIKEGTHPNLNKKQRAQKLAKLNLALTKRRQAISIGSLVAKKAIKLEDVNPMEIILNYANKKGKDFALTNIRDAAIKNKLIKYQKTKPKGWKAIPKRLDALLIGKKKKGFATAELLNTIDDTLHSVESQTKWEKGLAITKMAAFYNPLFLPAYDIVQFGMLGPWKHLIQATAGLGKAWMDVWKRTDDYYEAARNNTFSKPFALPFEKQKSAAEQLTTETTSGWYASQIDGMISQMFNIPKGSILKPLYQASWTTAWHLDEVVRMASYNFLRKRGHSPSEAGQTAATFHGDYARVPAKTRKALNKWLFTPTFKIAMGGLWLSMMKNLVTTVGGLRKKGTTKVQRRLAYGAISTVGMNLAFHILMTSFLGFEEDQWGRRYVKTISTAQGPKEIVITWSTPANIAFKYIYRLTEALKPGVENPVMTFFSANKWELHPVYRGLWSIMTNKRAGGEEVYNENDNPETKLIKMSEYLAESLVGMYSGAKMMTGKHGGTYSTQQARKRLTREYGLVWKLFLQHFMFSYVRDIKDKRKKQKIKAMLRRLNKSIRKSEIETKTHDKVWLKNFKKTLHEIVKQ